MELKTKYQYTYFIYPYVVENYEEYLRKILKNNKYKIKKFDRKKDSDLYTYFLPKVRSNLFWNMSFDEKSLKKFSEIDKSMQPTLLAEYPCTIFEYSIKKDIQGKAGKKDGIFFNINKIELVCFNTGICFMLMKTQLQEGATITDVCNFNYKFRDIKSDTYELRGYENIKIQTDIFTSVKQIKTLIKEITGENKGAKDLNLDSERFITYSYTCIAQEDWNENTNEELLEKEFYKLINVEKSDSAIDCKDIKKKMSIIEKSKYEIYGSSNIGTALITSDANTENCTIVPSNFERQYLYQYIYELYKKIYIKKLNYEFQQKKSLKKAESNFVAFTQGTWSTEITNDRLGIQLEEEWKEQLKLEKLYSQVRNKYDLLYKNNNIEKTAQTNKIIIAILAILVIINIINIFRFF